MRNQPGFFNETPNEGGVDIASEETAEEEPLRINRKPSGSRKKEINNDAPPLADFDDPEFVNEGEVDTRNVLNKPITRKDRKEIKEYHRVQEMLAQQERENARLDRELQKGKILPFNEARTSPLSPEELLAESSEVQGQTVQDVAFLQAEAESEIEMLTEDDVVVDLPVELDNADLAQIPGLAEAYRQPETTVGVAVDAPAEATQAETPWRKINIEKTKNPKIKRVASPKPVRADRGKGTLPKASQKISDVNRAKKISNAAAAGAPIVVEIPVTSKIKTKEKQVVEQQQPVVVNEVETIPQIENRAVQNQEELRGNDLSDIPPNNLSSLDKLNIELEKTTDMEVLQNNYALRESMLKTYQTLLDKEKSIDPKSERAVVLEKMVKEQAEAAEDINNRMILVQTDIYDKQKEEIRGSDLSDIPPNELISKNALKTFLEQTNDIKTLQQNRDARKVAWKSYRTMLDAERAINPKSKRAEVLKKMANEQADAYEDIMNRIIVVQTDIIDRQESKRTEKRAEKAKEVPVVKGTKEVEIGMSNVGGTPLEEKTMRQVMPGEDTATRVETYAKFEKNIHQIRRDQIIQGIKDETQKFSPEATKARAEAITSDARKKKPWYKRWFGRK